MDKKFTVYRHSSPNGKIYIGITCQEPNKRWKKGFGYKNNVYFFRAIQKYGWDNFKHEILFENMKEEEAIKKEAELIMLFKSYLPQFGYNIRKASKGKGTMRDDTIEKISRANRRSGFTLARKKALEKARIVCKKRTAEKHHNSKKIVCLNNNKIYPSIITASKELGISRQSIQAICNKEFRHAYGYIFLPYDEYLVATPEQINKLFENIKQKKASRNRKVINITTGEIFNSIKDATEKYKVKNISAACRGIRNYAGTLDGKQLKWMYYDEYLKIKNKGSNQKVYHQ